VHTKKYSYPWGEKKVAVSRTEAQVPILYYGGKAGIAEEILDKFPPGWSTVVDLFGGGGSVTFRLAQMLGENTKKLVVYNDIGNVANFMRCLRDYGDETYMALSLTPYSREEYLNCRNGWGSQLQKALESGLKDDYIEWARMWYTQTQIGFSHEEFATGFKVSKTVNAARSFSDRVDTLPSFVELLKNIIVEKGDYNRVLELYDSDSTLFYADPPYVQETRNVQNRTAYLNEMPEQQQITMLERLCEVKGQVVVSGYHSELYDEKLKGFRKVTMKTKKVGIVNSNNNKEDRTTRTEILWIKEKSHGLWSNYENESADVAGIST
jgi:DNA adenine methylase